MELALIGAGMVIYGIFKFKQVQERLNAF